MHTPIFLSVSRPQHAQQEQFLARVVGALAAHGLAAHTVGVTESCHGSPLPAIRRLMTEVQGLVVVAFRRTRAPQPQGWQTSLFCQVEMAMAYQRELPILVVRERGVLTEGMLDAVPGCCYTPEFDLEERGDCDRVLVESAYLLADWCTRLRGGQHASLGG